MKLPAVKSQLMWWSGLAFMSLALGGLAAGPTERGLGAIGMLIISAVVCWERAW